MGLTIQGKKAIATKLADSLAEICGITLINQKFAITSLAHVPCFGMIKIRAMKQLTLKKFFVTLSEERWPSG
jgi:hypothetical protein